MQESKAQIGFVQSTFMILRFIIYVLERKILRKTSVTQANAKVMFHAITSLGVASDVSALYFKLMTYPVGRLAKDQGFFFFNNMGLKEHFSCLV